MNKVILAMCFLVLPGCASHLNVYREETRGERLEAVKVAGIPYFAPKMVTVKKITSYEPLPKFSDKKEADYCKNSKTEYEQRVLPVGEKHYIALDPAAFGKAEFSLEFMANGALSKATLNSDSTEAVGKATDLLSAILPYVATTRETSVAAQVQRSETDVDVAADKGRSLYCTTNEVIEVIVADR